jgi:hypothetical protein
VLKASVLIRMIQVITLVGRPVVAIPMAVVHMGRVVDPATLPAL